MADPTNLSLKGIVDWAQDASGGQGADPPVNDINADKVDGYHYSEIMANATAAGGGGCVARGTSTFVGNGGGRAINFTPNLAATPYNVVITPSAGTSSREGEYWVVKTDGANFTVYNAGSGTSAFDWAVMVKGTLPQNSVLNDLLDVTINGAPTSGQILQHNGSQWVNSAAPSSGVTSLSANSPLSVNQSTGAVTMSIATSGLGGGIYTTHTSGSWFSIDITTDCVTVGDNNLGLVTVRAYINIPSDNYLITADGQLCNNFAGGGTALSPAGSYSFLTGATGHNNPLGIFFKK